MSNLQKFNQTLEDFNQEVEQLKEVSGAYKKLQQLTESYNAIIKQFEVNSKALDKINELQKAQQEKVAKTLTEIENANVQNKSEISKLFETKADQIRKENKEFYKDLESTIKIKLDENKSEIKKLIENERNQINQIFEIEFAKHTQYLKGVVQTENKTLKFSIWILGVIIIILGASAVIKLLAVIKL